MVGAAGLEPATLCLEGRCSIHLSYAPTAKIYHMIKRFAEVKGRNHVRSSGTKPAYYHFSALCLPDYLRVPRRILPYTAPSASTDLIRVFHFDECFPYLTACLH